MRCTSQVTEFNWLCQISPLKYLDRTEEEKLKFYITCSLCLCNSACSLQSLDHVGHVVSENGELEY